MNEHVNEFFTKAVEKLNEANAELSRPEEDIVTYMVCKNSQTAIENYLKGFLVQHGVNADNYITIEALYAKCLKMDNKFKNIDLSDFRCRSHKIDSVFCNEFSQVSNCYDTAEKLKNFLSQEKVIR